MIDFIAPARLIRCSSDARSQVKNTGKTEVASKVCPLIPVKSRGTLYSVVFLQSWVGIERIKKYRSDYSVWKIHY
jgi:hypothetical protein